jgi:2-aminoadipate transaminase
LTDIDFEQLLSSSAPGIRPSGELPRGKYDFAIAYPDPGTLPLDGLVDSLKQALDEEGAGLALYPDVQGYPPLREFVAAKLNVDRGMAVGPDNVVLGDGSSQHLAQVIGMLVDPGDVVVTEDFFYSGTLGTFRMHGADIRGVTCDEEGMLPDVLESVIAGAVSEGKRPKMIYTIPSFQNPQGWTMTLARRQSLIELSHKYGVPVFEDDCYVDLRYDGESVPAIHSLDPSGQVMYVGSFSKTVAPGVRMGYFVGPEEIVGRMRTLRKTGGSGVNQLTALAIDRFGRSGLPAHVVAINNVQRARRDAMTAALGENFGDQAEWTTPEGGLYLWLKMAEGTDIAALRDEALNEGVGYQPGPMFAPDGVSGKNYARLCFGYNNPTEIHEGIARMAEVFAKAGVLEG